MDWQGPPGLALKRSPCPPLLPCLEPQITNLERTESFFSLGKGKDAEDWKEGSCDFSFVLK